MIDAQAMRQDGSGYFQTHVPAAGSGTRYRYRLPHGSYPDPASRYQPEGPHGPSMVIDPAYPWTDAEWRGLTPTELVIYELHLGTFTPEGTWRSAMAQLPELARLGITCLEVMPVAEFPGTFGWGYDGVDLYAPSRLYGRPEDAKAFVNRAHQLGLMVILDVVYNHLGPDGCYLREFCPAYFSTKYQNEWGDPLNFDGEDAGPVREFFIQNARYWVDEYHFDGLRLDATQQIFDASATHVVAEIANAVRAAAPRRTTFVVAENESQEAVVVRPASVGGYGLDAVWNDDFHHSATVAATGKSEAYYIDFRGSPQEFVSAVKHGFLYQGQLYRWQRKRRGSPALDLTPQQFVAFLQNHDQIANSLHGHRLHQQTSPGKLRALTALLLLNPSIPMLFQGQEFGASAPFVYFADHKPELGELVAKGRREFLLQFRTIAAPDARDRVPDPRQTETFARCKLDWTERERNRELYRLHEDLLRLRHGDRAFRQPSRIDGAILGPEAFLLRFFHPGGDRLLIVNLGIDLYLASAPEPLLAPPVDCHWRVSWSSEAPEYAGGGTPALETQANWIIPGPAAFVLTPDCRHELPHARLSEND